MGPTIFGGRQTNESDSRSTQADDEAFWRAAQQALKERARRVRHERVKAFLQTNGFSGINNMKGWFLNRYYPLHAAVDQCDAEMVRLLLESKASRKYKDAKGRTARQLAKHRNTNGSHAAVLAEFAKMSRTKAAKRAASSLAKVESPDDKVLTGDSSKVLDEREPPNRTDQNSSIVGVMSPPLADG